MLGFSYMLLTLMTVIFLCGIGLTAIYKTSINQKKDSSILIIGLIAWQLFIVLMSKTGILESYDFPPRFALAFIFPTFIFTGIFLYRNRNKKWIKSIPEHWIVYFQSFRILVEIIFVFSVSAGILNPEVTIEGYNYDMVFAATAPIIGLLVYSLKILPRKIVLIWNFIGVAVLISVIVVFMTSIYKPEMYGSSLPILPLDAMTYPYNLVAAFLMPTAVFLHILSIIQLTRKNNN